jgi:hypothetical protein
MLSSYTVDAVVVVVGIDAVAGINCIAGIWNR